MGVRRHRIPHVAREQLGDAHHELGALRSTGVDVFRESTAIRLLRGTKLGWRRCIATDARRWMRRMGGIAHYIESGRARRVVAFERHLLAASANIQYVA